MTLTAAVAAGGAVAAGAVASVAVAAGGPAVGFAFALQAGGPFHAAGGACDDDDAMLLARICMATPITSRFL